MNKAIVTGNTGPGATVTELELKPLESIVFDLDKSMVNINYAGKTFNLAYTGVATVEFSISGGDTTVTIE